MWIRSIELLSSPEKSLAITDLSELIRCLLFWSLRCLLTVQRIYSSYTKVVFHLEHNITFVLGK